MQSSLPLPDPAAQPIYDTAPTPSRPAVPDGEPMQIVTEVRQVVQATAKKAETTVVAPLQEFSGKVTAAKSDLQTKVESTVSNASATLETPPFVAGGGALLGGVLAMPFTSGWRRALFVPLVAAVTGTGAYIGTVGIENVEMPTKVPTLELPTFELPAWMRTDSTTTPTPPSVEGNTAASDTDFGQAKQTDLDTYPSRKPHTTDGSTSSD